LELQRPSYQTTLSSPTASLARALKLAKNIFSNILHVIQEEVAQASTFQSHANREANFHVACQGSTMPKLPHHLQSTIDLQAQAIF
jgi:hypothetical protein